MGPSIMDNLEVHLVRPGADMIEEEPVSDHPVEPHSLFNVCVPRDPSIHSVVNWENHVKSWSCAHWEDIVVQVTLKLIKAHVLHNIISK